MPATRNRVSDPLSPATMQPALPLDTVAARASPATVAARACAREWADQSREHDARRWTSPIPVADLDYLEQEILGRPADEEESAEFSRAFIDEYNACMQQRSDREGWS